MKAMIEVVAPLFAGYLALWVWVYRFRPGGVFRYGGYFGFEDRKSLRRFAFRSSLWMVAAIAIGMLVHPREHMIQYALTFLLGVGAALIHISNVRPRLR